MNNIQNALYTFFFSMVPIFELRGAIPLGASFGLPWLECYLICVIGNLIPVPFILLFIRAVLHWMKKVKHLEKIANWIEKKAEKNKNKVMKYASLGLFLFVAIPVPGTGAWTGSLVAAMMDMRMKYALPSIIAGVLVAGFIMSGISYGFLSALSFFA